MFPGIDTRKDKFLMQDNYTTKDIERFWQKVDKRGPDDCWEWLGSRGQWGHGRFNTRGTVQWSHRISYELANGPIPDGLIVRHKCNFSPCCNPAHLILGTQADNVQDKLRNKEPIKDHTHPIPGVRPWSKWGGKKTPPEERFWTFVNKTDTCWIWTGHLDKKGYGNIATGKKTPKTISAHRFSWIMHNGPILDGLHVLHRCDNPCCVNPDHLFLGTHKENMEDCKAKGRIFKTGEQRPRGEANPAAKLTAFTVLEIRRIHAEGKIRQKEIAKLFGISPYHVSDIVTRHTWKHI
jgi:HNH endonuclease